MKSTGFLYDGDMNIVKVIRSQRANYVPPALVGGAGELIVLGFEPQFDSMSDLVGVPLRFVAKHDTRSPTKVSVDGMPPVRLIGPVLKAGREAEIMYDGTHFIVVRAKNGVAKEIESGEGPVAILEKLAAAFPDAAAVSLEVEGTQNGTTHRVAYRVEMVSGEKARPAVPSSSACRAAGA